MQLTPYEVALTAQQIEVKMLKQQFGALGWKVNGPSGDGGSITILGGLHPLPKRDLVREAEGTEPPFRRFPFT